MIGSLIQIFPGTPQGVEWLSCTLTFLVGFGIFFVMGREVADPKTEICHSDAAIEEDKTGREMIS